MSRHWSVVLGWLVTCLAVGSGLGPSVAAAQDSAFGPLTGRLSLHVNGLFQGGSKTAQQVLEFPAFGEQGRLETDHQFVDGGGLVGGGGRIRVHEQLVVGATFSQSNASEQVTLTGSVPHPQRANQPRTLEPITRSDKYRERATHFEVGWVFAVPDIPELDITVFGGPSFFNARRIALTDIRLSEGRAPFRTVGVDLDTEEQSRNAWGGHVGVDITFLLTEHIGLGGVVRFTGASVIIADAPAETTIDVGGFQAGGGLRIRF